MLNNHIGISAFRRRVFLRFSHVKPNAPVRKRRTLAAVAILKAKKRFVLPYLFAKKKNALWREMLNFSKACINAKYRPSVGRW